MGDNTPDEEMRDTTTHDKATDKEGEGKRSDKPKPKKNEKEEEVELSEEDAQLKENLELMVTRLGDTDQGVVKLALTSLMYGMITRSEKILAGKKNVHTLK